MVFGLYSNSSIVLCNVGELQASLVCIVIQALYYVMWVGYGPALFELKQPLPLN